MKKYILLLLLLMITLSSYSIKNWKIYTNTTHIYDAKEINDKLFLATWGGLVEFDIPNKIFTRTRTNIDGLSENDLRVIDYLENNEQLLLGSYSSGIDRLTGTEFSIPINETIGLASNTVNKIVHNDSLIIVATQIGLSVFKLVENFPFPLLIDNFDVNSGLSAYNITSLLISESGYVICGSENGIDYIHVDSLGTINAWNSINTNNSLLPDNNINSLSANMNWLAIGTRDGLAKVMIPEFTDWTIYDEISQGTDQSIFPVLMDSNNNIWYSFGYWEELSLDILDNGEYALGKIDSNDQIQQWTTEDLEIPTDKVMKIIERQNGEMLLLTWGNSIILQENGSWISYELNSISASLIKEMVLDDNSKLWTSSGYMPPGSNPPLPRGTAGISSLDNGVWYNYSADDSPLISDNIFSVEVDQNNKKWFGAWYIQSTNPYGWVDGISIFDELLGNWTEFDSSDGIRNDAISDLYCDDQNRMWVCSFSGSNGGISVIDVETNSVLTTFELYETEDNAYDALKVYIGRDKAYFGGFYSGLRIWNEDSIPEEDGAYWSMPPFNDLRDGMINDIISIIVDDREELWVASDNGLFNLTWSTYFNSSGSFIWHKYGTVIKRKAWYNNSWFDEQSAEFWYIEGQERLFGSVPTFPTALLADPFDNIWIATDNNGISVYNLKRDTFTNYNMDNSPLISNKITDLAYDEYSGNLYIGTNNGLHAVEIGIPEYANTETDLAEALVYPNPFYPEKGELLRIENANKIAMPKGETECRIYDLAGDLIITLEKDIFEQFSWDGLNRKFKKCGTGIYLYVISTPDGQTMKGKIALIR